MSLGIAFKGPEGIVLAADSRVTLSGQGETPKQNVISFTASFDNATKLLQVSGQKYVGVVTYGLGAIGQKNLRTAHSLLPEFEAELAREKVERLPVKDFANRLSVFFVKQWSSSMPKEYSGPDIAFLIGGYDDGEPYGKVFEIGIPSAPNPKEWNIDEFGIVWGGQLEFTNRLLQGFDPSLPNIVEKFLNLTPEQTTQLSEHMRKNLGIGIPYPFLPLQDCVDLSIFLIRTTAMLQKWIVGVRGVGGAIDVAIITRIDGFLPVQQKKIYGESHLGD